jgi:hypothetical protein
LSLAQAPLQLVLVPLQTVPPVQVPEPPAAIGLHVPKLPARLQAPQP